MEWINEPTDTYKTLAEADKDSIDKQQVANALDAALSRYRYLQNRVQEFEDRYQAELAVLKRYREEALNGDWKEIEQHRRNITHLMDLHPAKTFKGLRGKASQRSSTAVAIGDDVEVENLPLQALKIEPSKSKIKALIKDGSMHTTSDGAIVIGETGEKVAGLLMETKTSVSISIT